MTNSKNKSAGFTLVEMMIALAVGGAILTTVAVIFTKQSDSKLIQEDVTEILQNSRIVRMMIADDLRMAGYYGPNGPVVGDLALYDDNTGNANPTASTLSANAITVRYFDDKPSYGPDVDGNGKPDPILKTVDYRLRDGVDNDTLIDDLGWTSSTMGMNNPRDLVGNIDGIEFLYTMNDGTNAINTVTTQPSQAQVPNIKAVTITMLLRGKFDRSGLGVTTTQTFRTPFGTVWGPPDDGFKRRIFTFTVSCRNLEL